MGVEAPRLDGKLFVVAGGAGTVGECVVAALCGYGARVVVPSRSERRLERLRTRVDSAHLSTVVTDLGPAGAAAEFRDRVLADLGPVDGVVAALGGWWEGPQLAELGVDEWHRLLGDNLTSHFVAARTFLPVLADRRDAVYLMLGGIAAFKPVPHSGPVSVTGAAQTMMLRVFAEELRGRRVRLHELSLLTPVVTARWDGSPVEPGWLTGEQVGESVAEILSPTFTRPDQLVLVEPAALLPPPVTTHPYSPAPHAS
ncbi:SDR family oxidoreductase [Micromonospora ureilytica]|uniref:SDR family oxidoreductase n=1 Tax=Micromonospora ureilytica TaxID=709868 RepID=UPI0033EF9ED6